MEQLLIINFESSGPHYVKVNRCGAVINVFDLNHNLTKNISLANLPLDNSGQFGDILYLSENLFNVDNKIEFMYCINNNLTQVYNEDGTLLFNDNSAPLIRINIPTQQLPIYNTPNGTKMILSCTNGQAKVFGLGGALSTAIHNATENVLNGKSYNSIPFPNPANQAVTIKFKLPNHVEQAELIIHSMTGVEIKRFTVYRNENEKQISTEELTPGIYYYGFEVENVITQGNKIVIIR
jgi:hypothetical protein